MRCMKAEMEAIKSNNSPMNTELKMEYVNTRIEMREKLQDIGKDINRNNVHVDALQNGPMLDARCHLKTPETMWPCFSIQNTHSDILKAIKELRSKMNARFD